MEIQEEIKTVGVFAVANEAKKYVKIDRISMDVLS